METNTGKLVASTVRTYRKETKTEGGFGTCCVKDIDFVNLLYIVVYACIECVLVL